MTNPHQTPPQLQKPQHQHSEDAQWQSHSGPSFIPIAEASLARDLEDDTSEVAVGSDDESSGSSTVRQSEFSMLNAYRRPSVVNPGARSAAAFASSVPERGYLSKRERKEIRDEERSLLQDNDLLPQDRPRRSSGGMLSSLGKRLSISALRRGYGTAEEEAAIEGPSETSALLADNPRNPHKHESSGSINRKWDEAVSAGKIQTTWQHEAKVLTKSSAPLILTFMLQYSLPVASIFTVGHIGKVELGAVSLAGSKCPLDPLNRIWIDN